jgi:hypothetical protein
MSKPAHAASTNAPVLLYISSGGTDMLPFDALLFSSQLLITVADGVPNIDVAKTCRNSATVSGTVTQQDIDACVADERGARDELVKEWAQFSASSKTQCVHASTDYLPSYVEVLTCLSISRDAKALPDEKAQRPRRQHK